MDSFNTKINRINDAKEAIKQSLLNKGIDVGDNIEDYSEAINNIESGSGDVKLFETPEEMQADHTAKVGDLAIIYRNEIQNAQVNSKFQTATFPDTVVLDTAMTDYVELRYRAVDSSKMFDCWGSLDSSMFMMECYTESDSVEITYESSDGITYTRTDTTGNPVDFGTEIYYEYAEMWNDVIGKFIQIGGSAFEGLYKYDKYIDGKLMINNVYLDNNVVQYNTSGKIPNIQNYADGLFIVTGKDDNGAVTGVDRYPDGLIATYKGKQYVCSSYSNGGATPTTGNYTVKHLDLVNNTETQETKSRSIISTGTNKRYYLDAYKEIPFDTEWFFISIAPVIRIVVDDNAATGTWYTGNLNGMPDNILTKYSIAPTQLTAIADYVYGKEFYGKNGVETGTLGVPDSTFADTNAEFVCKIQNIYNDMEPRILTDDDKTIDKNIYFIPVKKDGTVLLDTSGVTAMNSMFRDCINLTTIPLLDTSSVINMNSMFDGCANLTTIPLLDTSKVTNMVYMFRSCTNLTTIPLLDTSKVTDMYTMFSGCANLTTIPLLDTSKATSMLYMFDDCRALTTIPQLDTSNVTTMYSMFGNCTNLIEIPLLDTSNVTDMQYMFVGCNNLTTVPLFDTSKATDMHYMFGNCSSLSDESLNNILAMCANATSYTDRKTLVYIGLTSEQANKCKTLSNYSAFTAAGWTTGY